jgi:hypothetical protein
MDREQTIVRGRTGHDAQANAPTAANYAFVMSDDKAQLAVMRNSETAIGRRIR